MKQASDSRLAAALAERSAFDPRDSFRSALRALKDTRPAAFRQAVQYYEEVVVPRTADPQNDPLEEWRAYGLKIATLAGEGRVVSIEPGGRATDHDARRAPGDDVLLYLPNETRVPALVLAGPARPSASQQASIDLLVHAKLAG